MGRSFKTECNNCGKSIKMVEDSIGGWQAFDANGVHFCNSSDKKFSWSLFPLKHKLTTEIHCWWCDKKVYYHTNGNGDSVLFDSLGKPWTIHPCWLDRDKKEQIDMVRKFEEDLIVCGYNGKDNTFSIIDKIKPFLTILFNDNDYRIVDKVLQEFCYILNKYHIEYKGPLLMPSKKEGINKVYTRSIKINKSLISNEVMIAIQNINLPSSVKVSFY